jgi:hypothetical protein
LVHVSPSAEYAGWIVVPSEVRRRYHEVGNEAGSTPVADPRAVGVLLSSLNASKRRPPLHTMPALTKLASSP